MPTQQPGPWWARSVRVMQSFSCGDYEAIREGLIVPSRRLENHHEATKGTKEDTKKARISLRVFLRALGGFVVNPQIRAFRIASKRRFISRFAPQSNLILNQIGRLGRERWLRPRSRMSREITRTDGVLGTGRTKSGREAIGCPRRLRPILGSGNASGDRVESLRGPGTRGDLSASVGTLRAPRHPRFHDESPPSRGGRWPVKAI